LRVEERGCGWGATITEHVRWSSVRSEAGGVRVAAFGVLEGVAFTFGLQDVTAMREAVQRGSRQALTAEDFGSVLKRQDRGHDLAVPFVSSGDHIEE